MVLQALRRHFPGVATALFHDELSVVVCGTLADATTNEKLHGVGAALVPRKLAR